jgi:hypothetical protein
MHRDGREGIAQWSFVPLQGEFVHPHGDRLRASSSACILALLAFAATAPARANQEYGVQIPHRQQVGGCDGLCHATGFKSSQFYKDFQSAGYDWNATMAGRDSDGDGFSNGWELQDPSGGWVSGTASPGSNSFVSDPVAAASRPPLPVATAPIAVVHGETAGQNGSELLAVQNVGAVPFDWSIAATEPWLGADPESASALPAGLQDELLVLFATDGLAAGLHQGELALAIPGIRADRIPAIPVDLTIPEPGSLACAAVDLLGLALLARRRSLRS